MFVERVIEYRTKNGRRYPGMLYESPFADAAPEGVGGMLSDDEADNSVAIVRSFNTSVEGTFSPYPAIG